MKKLLLLTAICAVPTVANAAMTLPTNPTTCEDMGLTPGDTCYTNVPGNVTTDAICTSTSSGCKLFSCSDGCTCSSDTFGPTDCISSSGGGTTCPSTCSSTSWTSVSTGYETRCYGSSCQYRCAAGYYGSPTSSTSGCTRCPQYSVPNTGGLGGSSIAYYGTSSAGSTKITSCYIPADTAFSDDTGSGTYTSNCNYSE